MKSKACVVATILLLGGCLVSGNAQQSEPLPSPVPEDDQSELIFPGYAQSFTEIGRERGWPPATRAQFDALLGPTGALLVGDPETVAEKILRVNESLGGISRLTFQMSVAALPHAKLMRAIELLGTRVAPLVRSALASETAETLLPVNSKSCCMNCKD